MAFARCSERLPEALIAEIDLYDAAEAHLVSERTRAEASLKDWVHECQLIYADILEEHRNSPLSQADADSAMAAHLQTWLPRQGLADELVSQLRRLPANLDPVQTNCLYSFRKEVDDQEQYFRLSGFSLIEPWGVWTDGELASIEMRLSSEATPKLIEIDLVPFINDKHPTMTVDVFANGGFAARRVFQHAPATSSQITPPAERWSDGVGMPARGQRRIRFDTRQPRMRARMSLQWTCSKPLEKLDQTRCRNPETLYTCESGLGLADRRVTLEAERDPALD